MVSSEVILAKLGDLLALLDLSVKPLWMKKCLAKTHLVVFNDRGSSRLILLRLTRVNARHILKIYTNRRELMSSRLES